MFSAIRGSLILKFFKKGRIFKNKKDFFIRFYFNFPSKNLIKNNTTKKYKTINLLR